MVRLILGALCALGVLLPVAAADVQIAKSLSSLPPAAASSEPQGSGERRILTEMWARVDHCATLNGYVDERTRKDNTPEQVRQTIYQMPDGYDCFGQGERTLQPISQIPHRRPVIIHQRMRR